tara:strand:+ start:201 stop:455 length:255 start_codon:yes stop_codon:yes gene_type:complete
MPWLYLVITICSEVAGTTSMKHSDGFTKLGPSVGIVVFYLISFTLLTIALKQIIVSVAYAIWSGFGTVLVTIIGFGDSRNLSRC